MSQNIEVKLGSVWLDKESGVICVVTGVGFEYGHHIVRFNYISNKGTVDFTASSGVTLFIDSKERMFKESELTETFNSRYQDGYKEGYAQAYSELHAPTSERERQLQEKAWDEGYKEGEANMLETVNELSAQQAEDYNNGEILDTDEEQLEKELALVKKYPHYYKDIRHLNIIDIYRFLSLFGVTDPCIQHAAKKLSVGGKRGTKDYKKDVKEAMDTLNRWEYMQEEDERAQDD